MIKSVTVTNLARWKWTHTITYSEGINILDWKFGSWKSSLLVDSLQLALTNTWRTKLEDVVTKWEDYCEIEIELESIDGKNYSIFWQYTPKKDSISKTGKVTKKPAKTIWEVYIRNSDWTKEKSNIKVSELLGIPYEIASKTFIITQNDIDGFSKLWPGERYELISSLFWISDLLKVGDIAVKRQKELIKEKETLLSTLHNISISDFDRIDSIKEEIDSLTQQSNNYQQQLKECNTQYIDIEKKKQELDTIDKLQQQKIKLASILQELQSKDYISIVNEIKWLETLINSDKNTLEIKELTYNLQNLIVEKDYMNETYKKDVQEITSKYWYLEKNKYDLLTSIKQQLEFLPKMRDNYLDVVDHISHLTDTSEIYNKKITLENSIKEIEKEIYKLELEISSYMSTINKLNSLHDTQVCPLCWTELSEEHRKKTLEESNSQVLQCQEKKKTLEEKLSNSINEQQKNNQTLQDIEYYPTYLKREELRSQWNKENLLYKELQNNKQQELLTLETQYKENINEFQKKELELQEKLYQLQKDSNLLELQKKKESLELTSWYIEGRQYTLNTIEWSINTLTTQIEEITNDITVAIKQSKNITREQLQQEYNTIVEKENNLTHTLQDTNQQLTLLQSTYPVLVSQKQYYDEIKDHISTIDLTLVKLERICSIFSKKWQPKVIIEQMIVPYLEKSTNSILEKTTNWRYTLELVLTWFTNEWIESKKNTFDIIVYQEWVRQTYDSLSWGEKMNINYALRLGITECLNQLHWRKITDFIILDESFNAIDSESSEQQILQSIRETSKLYKQMFIITHVDELKEWLRPLSTIYSIEKHNNYSQLHYEN